MKRLCAAFVIAVAVASAACESKPAIVLWHAYAGDEAAALAANVATYNQAHPELQVLPVAVPHDGMADKLAAAIPHGNGPCLFIYPHDRLGDWLSSGLVESLGYYLTADDISRFIPRSVEPLVDGDTLWGLPLAVKTVALYYRTDKYSTAPRTFAELFTQRATTADGEYPLGYVNGDLYSHAALLFGFGGQLLTSDERLAIHSDKAVAAARFARELVERRIVPNNLDGPTLATLFSEGKVYAAISGPWFAADIKAGVEWKVTHLPLLPADPNPRTQNDELPPRSHPDGGTPLRPFVGADAIFMSTRCEHKDQAFAAMQTITSDSAAQVRMKQGKQIVANLAAYQGSSNAFAATFSKQIGDGVAMPHAQTMRMIWTPYKTALTDIIGGRVDASNGLLRVQREVEGYQRGAN